jgi:recombination protein RecA
MMPKHSEVVTPFSMKDKRDRIDVLIKSLNKRLGGEQGRAIIQRGSEIAWLSASRLPTGSLGLDIALNGGLPRGAVVQMMGEESSGKTTMALKCCSNMQSLFGDEVSIAWIAVEGFDKEWANRCGVRIPFSKAELLLMRKKDRERWRDVKQVGEFVVSSAISGEDALEMAEAYIKSGLFHAVIVDSIAALPTIAELDKPMDEHTMTQLPRLVGKFLKKCYSAFNTRLEDGTRNKTAVILINQVREKIGGYGHPEPDPPGGRALRHAAHATVRFKKGEIYRIEDGGEKRAYGRRTKIKVEKSKIGPPHREAEFDFYFDDFGSFGPGDIDVFQELRIWGVRAGLIETPSNTVYVFNGKKFKGKAAMDAHFATNLDVSEELRRTILRTLTSAEVE